jgi:MiaB-like tRNA modifying enzyme
LRVYLKTFGCSSNRAETAALETLLLGGGFEVVNEPASAEAVVINTCTVRRDTELRMMKYMSSLTGRKIVVTGCMAEAQPATIAATFPQASIVSPHNLPMVAKALAAGQRSVFMDHDPKPLDPAPYGRGVRHVVTISRGCLGDCTYCIVRVARGRLTSVRPDKILDSISLAVREGAREVLLSAQDTGVYGMDLGTDLPALLHSLARFEGSFRVRLGMFNPSSVIPFLQRLIEAFDNEKLYKFAHVPVQSGSDSILNGMGRHYGVDDFRRVITSLRSRHPEITLFTDIIVGFPGESEEDFRATCLLLEEIRSDKTHIARFSPRPRTPASAMRQLPEAVKKKRSIILTEIAMRVQREINSQWIGRAVGATVVDYFAKGGMIARTDQYKTVAIGGLERSLIGERVEVSILSATPFFLIGEINRH